MRMRTIFKRSYFLVVEARIFHPLYFFLSKIAENILEENSDSNQKL